MFDSYLVQSILCLLRSKYNIDCLELLCCRKCERGLFGGVCWTVEECKKYVEERKKEGRLH